MSLHKSRAALGLFALITALAATARCSCAIADRGFECGKPIDTDQEAIRRCSADHEVCVCATNSCASRDQLCKSGFRYVKRPFAKPCADGTDDCVYGQIGEDKGSARIAGECVSPPDIRWRVDPGADQPRCGDLPPDGGADADEDAQAASSSSGGANDETGAGGSTGTMDSGMGGSAGGKP
jgi:hypothetical protein